MSRAEQEAYKVYPEEHTVIGAYSTGGLMTKDFNAEKRQCFIEGYEQAERDLALTADDVGRILDLIRKTQIKYNATVGCFPEVAEIFNETRKRG